MATTAENGLFPPFMESYLPAQVISDILGKAGDDKHFDVTLNPSPYNTLSDIHAVHITIVGQTNYRSIFDSRQYTMGIYVYDLPSQWASYTDKTIEIPHTALNPSELRFNEYYQIQCRFCKTSWAEYIAHNPDPGATTTLVDYLTNESVLAQCSEWSTVCLGRIIADNNIVLKANNILLVDETGTSSAINVDTSKVTLTGSFIKKGFNNLRWVDPEDHSQGTVPIYPENTLNVLNGNDDAEYLTSYRIKLYEDMQRQELLYDSGIISSNFRSAINEINYTIPYSFENDETVYIDFSYQTCNLYEQSYDPEITGRYDHASWTEPSNPVDEITGLDTVIGKVSILFVPKVENTVIPAGSTLLVRRSSDESNFKIWDTIWTKIVPEGGYDSHGITFEDFTIESGTLYKYEISAQIGDTIYTIIEDFIISVFDNAFLTGEGTQLCVRFNPNLSSYKYNVGDNVVTTIGSQYPYFNRNGNMNYRTFSLSGSIAYEMDIQHTFSSRNAIYGDWIDVYGTYFVNHHFNQQNDRVTQRKFRERVMAYLYSDVPKLFRSTPEGNILVRISDVNLSPKNELGRLIYDFTCTATEIGEANIENCKLYKVQDFGDL